MLLGDIIRAKELRTHELHPGVHKWSELMRKYENTSGETPSDSVKMTVLQNVRPKEVRTYLQLCARRLKCAQDVKEEVLAHMSALTASTKAGKPMNVDSVQGKREPAKQK